MTAPKLVSNPPEGSGLVPSIDDAGDGRHRTVTYEAVRLEVVRDAHDADTVTWILQRAHDLRHSGSQMTLPVTNNPSEMRANILTALDEWAAGENVTQDQLNERWVSHFGGEGFAATHEVGKGSLAQLQEFAGHVGAIDDPYADGSSAEAKTVEDDTEPAAEDDVEPAPPAKAKRGKVVPFQAPAGDS